MEMGKMILEPQGWQKPAWVSIRPEVVLAKAVGMGAEDCKAWVVHTMAGCISGEREEGSDADILLREAMGRIERKRLQTSEAGKASAEARRARAAEREFNGRSTDVQCEFNGRSTEGQHTNNNTDTETENKDKNSKNPSGSALRVAADAREGRGAWADACETIGDAPGAVGASGGALDGVTTAGGEIISKGDLSGRVGSDGRSDGRSVEESPVEMARTLDTFSLPAFAVAYCQDAKVDVAHEGYKAQLVRLKGKRFREVLVAFVEDVESGKVKPRSRGAVLMKRLQKEA